jgi:hypothetical protein
VLDGHGAQAVGLVRVLGRLGWEVTSEAETRASRSRWSTSAVELPSPHDDPGGFAAALRDACDQRGFDLVVPSGDLTLACCWEAAWPDSTIADAHVLAGDRRSAEVFLDKHAGVAAARGHGFGVPETIAGDDAAAVVAAAADLGFPCVIKPRRTFQPVGGTMRQLRHVVVDSRAQAEGAVATLTGDEGLLPLAQPFVPGPSLGVTAVLRRGRVVAFSARETLSFFPLGGGTSVWKRTVPPTTPGVGEALDLMRDFGVEGIAEVEYKLAPEGPRFMELGPRIHGWVPLAEVSRPGFVAAAVETALGRDVDPLPTYRWDVEMRWLGGDVHRLRAIAGRHRSLPLAMSRRTVVRTLWPPWRPGMRYDGVDLSDPGPWMPRPVGRALRLGAQALGHARRGERRSADEAAQRPEGPLGRVADEQDAPVRGPEAPIQNGPAGADRDFRPQHGFEEVEAVEGEAVAGAEKKSVRAHRGPV